MEINSVSQKMVEFQEDPCEKFEKLIVSLINKSLEEINFKEVAQAQVEEPPVAPVQEQVPQEEQEEQEEQVVQELVAAPVKVEEQLSEEFVKLVESIPETTHTLIENYNSYSNLEITYLCNKLREEDADILNLLEFYVNGIYPGDYHFGIPFALNAIVKQKQSQIVEKIKSGIKLSIDEENILNDDSHSGSSFCGLMYWLKIIFQKMQGDSFDNYHIVFNEKGEKQRIVPLFEKY